MRTALVGQTYQERSLPFDAQRSVNLYPVLGDQGSTKVAAMYGTPGLDTFTTAGAGPIRGGFDAGNGRVFFVSGTNLYEVDEAGTVTSRGSLQTSEGIVSIAESPTYLAICDGTKLYSFAYATNTFALVTDGDLPSGLGYVCNIDGYFIVSENGSGRFWKSALNDPTDWDALDYATAENNPDNLVCPINAIGQLWLFGEKTTEVWTNRGGSSFPFARIAGALLEVGAAAKNSVVEIDNTVIWLGRDKFGNGTVYRASGFSPQRISTSPIEKKLQDAASISNVNAWAYQEDGHLFYILTGDGLETSFCYDLTTGLWHERAYLNEYGNFEQHLGSCHVFAFGKHLIGSRVNGTIYEMSLDYYDDDGDEIARERTFSHIVDEKRRIRYNSLEIDMETGVGNATAPNPVISLELSRDGARTWSDPMSASIGALGEYQKRVKFYRLGVADQMTFRLRITDQVKVALIAGYLK